MASKPSPHVLIIGAGIGGLTLAQCLRKRGISYEIFDRDTSDHARPEGWAIGIHSMLDDVRASFPEDMTPVEQLSHLWSLNLPAELVFYSPPGYSKVGVRDDGSASIIRINRWRLRDWLATKIPIQYGKRVVRIEENKDSATAYFSDGTTATGDIVVGADGPHSPTRQHLFPDNDLLEVEPLLIISCDATLDRHDMEQQLSLGHSGYVILSEDTDGHPTFFFFGLNQVLPDGKSGTFFLHVMQRNPDTAKDDFWAFRATADKLLDEARRLVSHLPARFKTIAERATPAGIRVPPIRMYTLLLDSLPEGRITLLGDAAHSMTAHRGEGGSHAMQDALNLARAIAKMNMDDEQGWKRIIGEYQKEMLERGSNAAKLSRQASNPGTIVRERGPLYVWGRPAVPLPEENITL